MESSTEKKRGRMNAGDEKEDELGEGDFRAANHSSMAKPCFLVGFNASEPLDDPCRPSFGGLPGLVERRVVRHS